MQAKTRRSGPLALTALALVLGLVPAVSMADVRRNGHHDISPANPLQSDANPAVETALRSVVVINAGSATSGPDEGGGSGFVFDTDGHVMTNAHVVGSARTVSVGLIDGRRVLADVIGVDPRTDVAVVRLPAGMAVPALALVDAAREPARVGTPVIALGSPMGFAFSATSGIVSGRGRIYDVLTPVEFLQHDAALNPGNSGGPLIDLSGSVLGVNTATPAQTLFDIGIGLAIPADVAADIARRLIESGGIARGALGIRVSHADEAVADALGAPGAPGALVDEVQPHGAAAQAGLRDGDLILSVDETPVAFPRDILSRTMTHRPGEQVTVDFVRARRRRSAVVTLQPDRPPPAESFAPAVTAGAAGETHLGLRTASADGGDGVVIVEVVFGSPAQLYGLGVGDRIRAVNGSVVGDPQDFMRRVDRAVGRVLVLRVERSGVGARHINIPRAGADSGSRRPGMASEQQSTLL